MCVFVCGFIAFCLPGLGLFCIRAMHELSRGVTIHQWHGSVRFTVLKSRFGSVRFCLLWG